MNSRLSERIAILGVINPQLVDNGTVTTGWVAMKDVQRAAFIAQLGATDTTSTVSVEEATSSGGAGAQSLKAATGLVDTDDNKQVIININKDELSAGFTHVRGKIVGGNGTVGGYMNGLLLGADARSGPLSDLNLASVAQVVA